MSRVNSFRTTVSCSGHRQPDSRLRALLSDCTACLLQNMFFWGRDVIYEEGNLLCEYGFERSPSLGLQGTSCYRRAMLGGYIELHGACAGWYPCDSQDGFVFIRPRNRVYRYQATNAPVPGSWIDSDLVRGDPEQIHGAARPFLRWWLEYEEWIVGRTDCNYRNECYRAYRSLPATLRHLQPEKIQQWLKKYLEDPSMTPRLFGRK